MDPTETRQLRALGQRLALYVRSRNKPVSRAALQAVTADLTAEYPELSQPLGDLVGRPGFRALLPLASQGRGTVEREALIQDAARIYLPGVTEALREVLGGFLELPEIAAKQVVEPRTTNSELPTVKRLEVVETPRSATEPVSKRDERKPPQSFWLGPGSYDEISIVLGLVAAVAGVASRFGHQLSPAAASIVGSMIVVWFFWSWWRKTR